MKKKIKLKKRYTPQNFKLFRENKCLPKISIFFIINYNIISYEYYISTATWPWPNALYNTKPTLAPGLKHWSK